MKPLDPNRYVPAELVDAKHRLPMPNGRLFGENTEAPGRETVDLFDPFVSMLFAGGSIKLVKPDPEPKRVEAEAHLDSPGEHTRS